VSRILLSEPLPLRTTRDLGDYKADVALAHRWGDLRAAPFELHRLSDTKFFVADHPMQVTGVWVQRERTLSFEPRLESDDAGHTWQVVEFTAPIDQEHTVWGAGFGKLDPATGDLVTNPADIMAGVCAIAGIDLTFPELREQASADGIQLAGSVYEVRAVKAWLDEIAASCGAIWTTQSSGLYPNSVGGTVFDLEPDVVGGLSEPEASIDDTCDVLRIGYARADATGRMLKSVKLAASPQLYGGVEVELLLPWVREARDVETIGTRVLRRMAGERFEASFTIERGDVRPGRFLRLVNNREWHLPGDDPVFMALAVDVDPDSGKTQVFGETLLSTPEVIVSGHSAALTDLTEGGVDVDVRDGFVFLTIRDEDGRPMVGVRVSLDGGAPRITNDQGIVSFVAVSGTHEVLIEKPGFDTLRGEIVVP
jgi:hypothetical protein